MKKQMVALMAFGLGVLAMSASGQTQTAVVPIGAETVAGSTGSSIPLGNYESGTFQVLYSADQLAAIPFGSQITGFQLRMHNQATINFPTGSLTIPKYEVRMARSTQTPATMSSSFAANMLDPVLVRSGSLSLAANAYTSGASGSTPEAWGPMITLSTPYWYQGGVLAMEFREEYPSPFASRNADIMIAPGIGTIMSQNPSTATTAAGIAQNHALIVRFTFKPPVTRFQTGITRLMILDDLANARGGSLNEAPLGFGARTNQYVAGEAEMRRLGHGSRLVGLFYRNASTAWPSTPQFFTKYDIEVARATNVPGSMSSTIAQNVGADATMVRSGPLNIPAWTFAGLGSGVRPAPWTFEIPFSTEYMYTGGPLTTLVRHNGVSGGFPGIAAGTRPTDDGYGTRVQGRTTTGSSFALTSEQDLSYSSQLWSADSGTVIPNANTTTMGNTYGYFSFSSVGTDWQLLIHASQLTHVPVGSQITGLTFRGRGVPPNPSSPFKLNSFYMFLSTAKRSPADASYPPYENEGADKVPVLSGTPLFFGIESFPGNTAVNRFGPTIHFERAFIYQGGDLCITAAGTNGGFVALDGTTNQTLVRLLRVDFNHAFENAPIVRLEYNPSVVAPAAIDNTSASMAYSPFYSSAGNVMQAVYAPEELRGLRAGSLVTGMSLRQYSRLAGAGDWPLFPLNISRFDVTLSTSPLPPSAMSDTFANNIGSDAITVRSGAMTIPARAFPFVQSQTRPNENDWFIQFTEPFVYQGGPLSVTLRHDSGAGGTNFYADVFDVNPAAAAGRWSVGASPDATVHNSGTLKGALAIRFAFVPRNYCPADLSNDGVVDDGDFPLLAVAYDTLDCRNAAMPTGCPADFNFDHSVDDADFVAFAQAYNEFLCP